MLELNKTWIFPCNRWLDTGEDDGKIEIEVEPTIIDIEKFEKCSNFFKFFYS